MSCNQALVIENDANQCFNTQAQLSPVGAHPRNEDQTDAVFSRDDEVYNIKEDPLLEHQKTNETPSRQQITKIEIIRLLFGCGVVEGVRDQYNIVDLMANIGSIGLYCFDVVTDIINGLYYYRRSNTAPGTSVYMSYFIYTVSIIVLSSLVLQVYSAIFERADNDKQNKQEKKRRKCCSWTQFFVVLFHIFQLAPVLRYFRIVRLGIKSLEMKLMYAGCSNQDRFHNYDRQWRKALSDVNHIRIVESFLESAPQLVLQIYIMVDSRETPPVTVVSCVASLLGFAVGYVSYQRSIRYSRPLPHFQLTIIGCLLIAVYQALTVLSRVFALALLLDANAIAFMACFGGRLLISWISVLYLDVDYCQGCVKKTFDALVTGLGYHFTYVNVKNDGKNKYRMTVYYLETLIENVAFAVIWFFQRDNGVGFKELVIGLSPNNEEVVSASILQDKTALQIVCLIPAVNILGILVMIVYYMCAHPRLGCCYRQSTPSEVIEMTNHDLSSHHHHHQVIAEKEDMELRQLSPTDDYNACGDRYQLSQTWPRSSSSSSRLSSSEEIAKPARRRLNSQILQPHLSSSNIASSVMKPCQGDVLYSSNFSFYSAQGTGAGGEDVPSTSLMRQPHVDIYQKPVKESTLDQIPAGELLECDDVDRLLEKKRQQKAILEQKKAWLQRRIDMQKRISQMSDFQPISAAHSSTETSTCHQLFSRLDPKVSTSPLSMMDIPPTAADPSSPVFSPPILSPNPTTQQSSTTQPPSSDSFSNSFDFLENLDVFPPPSDQHLMMMHQPRCKTYPRKRSNNHFSTGQNSPLLKELMKQRMGSVTGGGQQGTPHHLLPGGGCSGGKMSTPAATFSLNDIAMRSRDSPTFIRPSTPLMGVSRTMSFTVRNDEIIDSIESSL